MVRRYSWSSKRNGRPSSRTLRTAHAASGSVLARVFGLASSLVRLVRYRPEDCLADAFTGFLIGHVLLHGIDETIDQPTDLGLRLGTDGLFGLARQRHALGQPLSLLGARQNTGNALHLARIDRP